MKTHTLTPFKITSDYNSIRNKEVFSDLLKVLMAYAHNLIGSNTVRLVKNKSDLAYDLSMEAILKYLENPEKFDPLRNPNLVWYIKFNILRRLIYNHRKLESQKNEVLFEPDDSNGIIVAKSFIKEMDLHGLIDFKNTFQLIDDQLLNLPKLKELFKLRYKLEYSRGEIIKELNISAAEYNNRIRRLNTIKNRIIKLQQIEIGS